MSSTLLQLRDQIILDAQIEGSPDFPIARLNRIINFAQRYVQTQLNGLGMKKWESSDSLSLTNRTWVGLSVGTANLSSDCSNMLEMPGSIKYIHCVDGSSNDGLAKELDDRRFYEIVSNTYTAPTVAEPAFMRLAQRIYIYPAPTTATAYYYKAITDLSSNTDTTEIPVEFEEFIVKRSVLEVDDIKGKLQDKELALRQLDKEIRETHERHFMKLASMQEVSKKDNAKLQ